MAPFPFFGTAAGAFLLGIFLPSIANILFPERWAKDKVLKRHGNALFRLLHYAATRRKLVAITLDNGKYYIAYVMESPNLDPQEQFLSILPLISGYRESDTLRVEHVVFYESVYKNKSINKNELAITLPLASIKIANLFDRTVYSRHFRFPERRT